MGTSAIFSSVQEGSPDGSKNGNLSYSHAGLDAWTDKSAGNGAKTNFDQDLTPICQHCGTPEGQPDNPVQSCWVDGEEFFLHRDCQADWLSKDKLSIPLFLKREPGS
jgi:hypothetical protein